MDWEIKLIEIYLLVEKYYLSELWIYSSYFYEHLKEWFPDMPAYLKKGKRRAVSIMLVWR